MGDDGMRRQGFARQPSRWQSRFAFLSGKVQAGTATDRETAEWDTLGAAINGRAAPARHEDAEARILASRARERWWWPGLTCHMPEMGSVRAGQKRLKAGGGTGWPDYTLILPCRGPVWGDTCALELKAAHVQPETARRIDGEQLGGLSADQAWWLRNLHDAGWQTCVAYGAEQALAALDMWAGPEPAELPRGWAERMKRGEL